MTEESYVTKAVIDICRRSFYIHSNLGEVKEIVCDSPKEFMNVLKTIEVCNDFDIEVMYGDPLISKNAGVV